MRNTVYRWITNELTNSAHNIFKILSTIANTVPCKIFRLNWTSLIKLDFVFVEIVYRNKSQDCKR
jgi:hypothetical protein